MLKIEDLTIGDKIRVVEGTGDDLVVGDIHTYYGPYSLGSETIRIHPNGSNHTDGWFVSRFKLVNPNLLKTGDRVRFAGRNGAVHNSSAYGLEIKWDGDLGSDGIRRNSPFYAALELIPPEFRSGVNYKSSENNDVTLRKIRNGEWKIFRQGAFEVTTRYYADATVSTIFGELVEL